MRTECQLLVFHYITITQLLIACCDNVNEHTA